jgi:hypothetical protein
LQRLLARETGQFLIFTAERAFREFSEPRSLDMLAAMYFEMRRVFEAVRVARRALEIASQRNDPQFTNELRARLSAYEAMLPAGQ